MSGGQLRVLTGRFGLGEHEEGPQPVAGPYLGNKREQRMFGRSGFQNKTGSTNQRSAAAMLAGLAAVIFLIAASALRIVSTYPALTQTYDEPAHLAAGMELLDRGNYTYEAQHPPLARIAVALGPYMLGARSHGEPGLGEEGNAILYSGDYQKILSAARLGVLPFFVLLVGVTAAWAWHEFGVTHAVVAALLLVSLPPVLAHAGLATTDLPSTAAITTALFVTLLWLEQPGSPRGALLGTALALAVTTKFSSLAYLPASLIGIFTIRWCWERGRWNPLSALANNRIGLAAGAAAFCALIWTAYDCPSDVALPWRQLWDGITDVARHNTMGHPAFFWGEVRDHGWWLFFPVALLVKTPLPFLFLTAFGTIVLLREHHRQWRSIVPLVAAAAMLIVAMGSHLDLGIRYVLPVYPMMALAAAFGAVHLLQHRSFGARGISIALLTAAAAVPVAAHPDYLPYFNMVAGRHPERLLVDSDLDWGQDVDRVAAALRARNIKEVALALQTNADLSKHGFPSYRMLEPHTPTSGWIAVGLTQLAFQTCAPPYDGLSWLKAYHPVAMIGKSVLLYHIDQIGVSP